MEQMDSQYTLRDNFIISNAYCGDELNGQQMHFITKGDTNGQLQM